MLAAIEAGDFPDILFAKDDKRLCSGTSVRQAGSSNGSGSRISRSVIVSWTLAIRERMMNSGSCSASSISSPSSSADANGQRYLNINARTHSTAIVTVGFLPTATGAKKWSDKGKEEETDVGG